MTHSLVLLATAVPLIALHFLRLLKDPPPFGPAVALTVLIEIALGITGAHILAVPIAIGIPTVTAGGIWALWVSRERAPFAMITAWALLAATVTAALLWAPTTLDAPQVRAATTLTALGALLLLTTPTNDLVKAVLDLATSKDRVEPGRPFKGGRWIGPLERVLILLLAMGGEGIALAAVIAAKGVIRFPEISKDETGTKAEEFLVGSMTSWVPAILLALIIEAA